MQYKSCKKQLTLTHICAILKWKDTYMCQKRGEDMKVDFAKLEIAKARACMTTKDICNAGFSKSTYMKLQDKKNVKPATVGRLAKILKCDVTEILEDE